MRAVIEASRHRPHYYSAAESVGSWRIGLRRRNCIGRGVPTTAAEILNRINEISFNSSLMRELRAIGFVTRLIQEGKVGRDDMKEMLIHSIRSDETMTALGVSSKFNADWDFLCFLHEKGRSEAGAWLATTTIRLDNAQASTFTTRFSSGSHVVAIFVQPGVVTIPLRSSTS
jgi:hypothetical protein